PATLATLMSSFFCYASRAPRDLHSFPTRRSSDLVDASGDADVAARAGAAVESAYATGEVQSATTTFTLGGVDVPQAASVPRAERSEEHTSELQSRENLVCRLLLEKKKKKKKEPKT